MASGVTVNSACLETFQKLKMKSTYNFITFKLNDARTEIVVDQTSESSDWDDFMQSLPENEPRYAVYDFYYDGPDGGARSKIVFITWSPDGARVKAKMIYASSKDPLKMDLGVKLEIQGNESDDITYDEVLEKVRKVRHIA